MRISRSTKVQRSGIASGRTKSIPRQFHPRAANALDHPKRPQKRSNSNRSIRRESAPSSDGVLQTALPSKARSPICFSVRYGAPQRCVYRTLWSDLTSSLDAAGRDARDRAGSRLALPDWRTLRAGAALLFALDPSRLYTVCRCGSRCRRERREV